VWSAFAHAIHLSENVTATNYCQRMIESRKQTEEIQDFQPQMDADERRSETGAGRLNSLPVLSSLHLRLSAFIRG
jgi:hypothetical protein